MPKPLQWLGQALVYLMIAALFGLFSDWPSFSYFPADKAQIVLSFAHGAERKGECRRLSAEEIAELPANMRRPEICPRERLPVYIELMVDGEPLFSDHLPPSGLAGDGPSQVHRQFVISPGSHRLTVRLRDSARTEGFDYERSETVVLRERQNFLIDFRADTGGFVFL